MRRIPLVVLLCLVAPCAAAHASAQVEGDPIVVRGRVLAVDGGATEGVVARLACGAEAAATAADSAGRFSLSLPCSFGAPSLELSDPSGRYQRALPSLAGEPRDGQRVFLLIPRLWAIASGSHAGAVVPVDLRGATTPACHGGCSAFYTAEDTTPSRPRGIPVWLEHSLPLRLAFSEDDGIEIPEADSIAFMRVAEALEADLGRRWFQPARFQDLFEVGPEDRFGSLVVSIDPFLRDAARGNWASQGGEIVAAVVYFQSPRIIRDPRYAGTVAHEIMHALGYGHTCSWRSVLTNESCRRLRADAPTPEDVAHAQLLQRLRTVERQHAIHGTIRATLAGMD